MKQAEDIVSGLSHITLIVRDLERSTQLLQQVFGAEEIYSSGSSTFSLSKEKFFLINDVCLCLMEGEPLPQRTYNHIAFHVAKGGFDEAMARVVSLGLEIRPGRPRMEGEGRSLYFYDYDNHLFELHTGSLDERLAYYVQDECDIKST